MKTDWRKEDIAPQDEYDRTEKSVVSLFRMALLAHAVFVLILGLAFVAVFVGIVLLIWKVLL